MTAVSFDLLKAENAATSNAIISHFETNESFLHLAKYEGDMTMARDKEDGLKLQRGIDFAKKKGVIDKNFKPEPYIEVDVLGKTPDDVANLIIESVKKNTKTNGGKNKGSVIVLVGLSGTGKGTTVSKLREKMEKQGKKVVTWSNGNIFRSVTLLAATYFERNNCKNFSEALTTENLADYMTMLSFGKFKGKYDTRIRGLGLELYVSDVASTDLKAPKVSKNIPTVAEQTQGEVILFAANAVKMMGDDGLVVLLEGREQTVNYVKTPHRFSLTLSDSTLIGKRRAAQRLMGESVKALQGQTKVSPEQVEQVLNQQLETMLEEVKEEEAERGYKGIFCWGGGKKK